MRFRAAALGALLAAACGQAATPAAGSSPAVSSSPAAVASPSPAASPSTRLSGLLFAVLEGSSSGPTLNADAVAIVGLDGYARAKQHFTPRKAPELCMAASLLQPEARVADGKVFYIDGAGQVRSLDPAGAVATVTSFSMGTQQAVSFAVDPTGQQLLGARITYGNSPPCAATQTPFAMDLYSASAGGPAQLGSHQSYPQNDSSANFIEAVGWDPAGALVTVHSTIATQSSLGGEQWYGQLAHWSPQGLGSVVGGSDCRAQDEQANSIACISTSGEGAGSVRAPDGGIRWNLPAGYYTSIRLSPDAIQAVYCNAKGCGAAGKDGSHVTFPSGFEPTGWLDASTVIGVQGGDLYGELGTISLGDPTKVDDLGFKGMFAGVVQAG